MFLLLGAVRNCPQSPQGEAVEKREVRGPRHSRNVLLPGKRGGGGSENVYIESQGSLQGSADRAADSGATRTRLGDERHKHYNV